MKSSICRKVEGVFSANVYLTPEEKLMTRNLDSGQAPIMAPQKVQERKTVVDRPLSFTSKTGIGISNSITIDIFII